MEASAETGRRAGVFGEPAGVTGLAGLRRAVADGIVGKRACALAVITGSGLKDVKTALRAVGKPVSLAPDDAALRDHLAEHPVA
jgi:threonine synthase